MIMPDLLLRNATVQEIQLELIRRTSFNALDGEKVYASLLRNRGLWLACLLDRPGLPDYQTPRQLLTSGLIKLRDLADDFWNADHLFILTETREQARQMKAIIDEEDWGGEVWLTEDQEKIDPRWVAAGRNMDWCMSGGIDPVAANSKSREDKGHVDARRNGDSRPKVGTRCAFREGKTEGGQKGRLRRDQSQDRNDPNA